MKIALFYYNIDKHACTVGLTGAATVCMGLYACSLLVMHAWSTIMHACSRYYNHYSRIGMGVKITWAINGQRAHDPQNFVREGGL